MGKMNNNKKIFISVLLIIFFIILGYKTQPEMNYHTSPEITITTYIIPAILLILCIYTMRLCYIELRKEK